MGAEKSKGMKQRKTQLRLERYLQGRCPSWGVPSQPGKLWECKLAQWGQQEDAGNPAWARSRGDMGRAVPAQPGGLCPWSAGRQEISKEKASPEKHQIPCADLLIPLRTFVRSV